MDEIKNIRKQRAVVDFSELGSFIRNPQAAPKAETYVSVDEVEADVFLPMTGNVQLPKIAPMSVSAPPGGFKHATFGGLFEKKKATIVDEMAEFTLDALAASSYWISCPMLDTSIEDFILFFKLIAKASSGGQLNFDVDRVKRVLTYMVTSGLSPTVEYAKAASDLGSKVLVRAMHELFVEGHNAVAFEATSDIVVPALSKSAMQVVVGVEDNIQYKNDLENNRFDFIKSLVGVNHTINDWVTLIQDKKYFLPENVAGTALSDAVGVSIGQVFPFPSAGRMILALQALDEIFGRKGIILVRKDKRNALFDPYLENATEYNRIVPYGSDADSMAKCALSYGYESCVAAYVKAYEAMQMAGKVEKRNRSIHERFKDKLGYNADYIADFELDRRNRCEFWEFISSDIADIDVILRCCKEGLFCLSYISVALQAKKSGADFFPFLIEPGLFLVLLIPKSFSGFLSRDLLFERRFVPEKIHRSVYVGQLSHKNTKRLHVGLTSLTVYGILTQYGVNCSARQHLLYGDCATPLDSVLKRSRELMTARMKESWNFVFIPSFGAKTFLDSGGTDELPDGDVPERSDDDSGIGNDEADGDVPRSEFDAPEDVNTSTVGSVPVGVDVETGGEEAS
jgi:hypothetical protein